MPRINTWQLIAALCSLASFAGCQTPDLMKPLMWTSDEKKIIESTAEKPQRLVVIWTAATYTEAGKPPTRGFGGRLYFYNAANKSVAVEGQLVVYGYDDTTPHQESRVPDRRYAFTPEQFKQHYDETDLGASYSVWIPWDAIGGPTEDISLLPIFTSSTGQVVVGQQTKNVLPGVKKAGATGGLSKLSPVQAAPWPNAPPEQLSPAANSGANGANTIRRVGYEEGTTVGGMETTVSHTDPRLTATSVIASDSIPLTDQMTSRLAAAGPTMALQKGQPFTTIQPNPAPTNGIQDNRVAPSPEPCRSRPELFRSRGRPRIHD